VVGASQPEPVERFVAARACGSGALTLASVSVSAPIHPRGYAGGCSRLVWSTLSQCHGVQLDELVRLLVVKGVITEQEWDDALMARMVDDKRSVSFLGRTKPQPRGPGGFGVVLLLIGYFCFIARFASTAASAS